MGRGQEKQAHGPLACLVHMPSGDMSSHRAYDRDDRIPNFKHRSGSAKAEVCQVYPFPRAAITNYNKLGGLNSRNVLPHCSGSSKSEIKVSVGLVPSGGSERESVLGLSPSFWR